MEQTLTMTTADLDGQFRELLERHSGIVFKVANSYARGAQDREDLAQEIGEYWANDITRGRGRFHNYTVQGSTNSTRCVSGVINHFDHAKRLMLRDQVLSDYCKDRQQVMVQPHSGCNLFGSGRVRRDRSNGSDRRRAEDAKELNQPRTYFV